MRTNDTSLRTNYLQAYNSFHSFNNNNDVVFENENYDSLSQRDTGETDNFNNYELCQKFGQPSIENTILLLILIILFSGFILYYYWNFFRIYYIRLLLISSSVDLILFLFYCALRLKINSNDWINTFPVQFHNFLDYVIIINFILKTVIFVMYFFFKIPLSSLFLFSGKYLLELYLLISCTKYMIFCPGYKSFSGCFEIGVGLIKNMLNCCEGQVDREYNRISEDSSDIIDNDNVL